MTFLRKENNFSSRVRNNGFSLQSHHEVYLKSIINKKKTDSTHEYNKILSTIKLPRFYTRTEERNIKKKLINIIVFNSR